MPPQSDGGDAFEAPRAVRSPVQGIGRYAITLSQGAAEINAYPLFQQNISLLFRLPECFLRGNGAARPLKNRELRIPAAELTRKGR